MDEKTITPQVLQQFHDHLTLEEKSGITIAKYLRDVNHFTQYASGRPITKELVIEYKKSLQENGYAVRSINSMLASLNSLLTFLGCTDCKVKCVKTQRPTYCSETQELSKAEYLRLLDAAKDQPSLQLLMQTICSTGIRVSELSYFTVEAVSEGEIIVNCKGKTRTILIPGKLKKLLLGYAKKQKIRAGVIFCTRNGKPLDRSNIWTKMKRLCKAAGVNPEKVYPHNLRKLFARTFYKIEKDIAKLADILGHSSINTTRIYIITTGTEHRKKMEKLNLLL